MATAICHSYIYITGISGVQLVMMMMMMLRMMIILL